MILSYAAPAVAVALALAGCLTPELRDCAVQCDPGGRCPAGLQCNAADGFCYSGGGEQAGCGQPDGERDGGQDRDGAPDPERDAGPPADCAIDILFIIDDTQTMDVEQPRLVDDLPAFIASLDAYRTAAGGAIDYRIAVTTTGRDVTYMIGPFPMTEQGDDGALRAGCGVAGRWIARGDADLAPALACRAGVGLQGPSLEMPLYTLELAFTARIDDATNAGFRRTGARLGVVLFTDEDDCSRRDNNFVLPTDGTCPQAAAIPVGESVQLLDDLAGDRSRWSAAVIAGPVGGCPVAAGEADPAPRLAQFVSAAAPAAGLFPICDDPSVSLATALDLLAATCE